MPCRQASGRSGRPPGLRLQIQESLRATRDAPSPRRCPPGRRARRLRNQSRHRPQGDPDDLRGAGDQARPAVLRTVAAVAGRRLRHRPACDRICAAGRQPARRRGRPPAALRIRRAQQRRAQRLGAAGRQDRHQSWAAPRTAERGRARRGARSRDRARSGAARRAADGEGPADADRGGRREHRRVRIRRLGTRPGGGTGSGRRGADAASQVRPRRRTRVRQLRHEVHEARGLRPAGGGLTAGTVRAQVRGGHRAGLDDGPVREPPPLAGTRGREPAHDDADGRSGWGPRQGSIPGRDGRTQARGAGLREAPAGTRCCEQGRLRDCPPAGERSREVGAARVAIPWPARRSRHGGEEPAAPRSRI